MSVKGHREHAPTRISCAVVTISDTRTAATDASGDRAVALLTASGYTVSQRQIVRDDPDAIAALLTTLTSDLSIDAIIATGGTGLSARDRTFDVISRAIVRPLPGFGELFRALSYEQIGAAAMLSRACAGTIGRVIVFSLPGSTDAVSLGVERLIAPELAHIVGEMRRTT